MKYIIDQIFAFVTASTTKPSSSAQPASIPNGRDGPVAAWIRQNHGPIVMGYIIALFAAIVAAYAFGYRADLVALVGCALGGLLDAMIWRSDENDR